MSFHVPRVLEPVEALGKLAELGDLPALEEALSRGDAAGASGRERQTQCVSCRVMCNHGA